MSTMAEAAWVVAGTADRRPAARFTRLLMRRGETCRIDRRFRRLRVLLGTAWVSGGGEDLLIGTGESAALPAFRGDFPVMSGVGGEVLVVELSG